MNPTSDRLKKKCMRSPFLPVGPVVVAELLGVADTSKVIVPMMTLLSKNLIVPLKILRQILSLYIYISFYLFNFYTYQQMFALFINVNTLNK